MQTDTKNNGSIPLLIILTTIVYFYKREAIQTWLLDLFWQDQEVGEPILTISTIITSLGLGLLSVLLVGLVTTAFVFALFNNIKQQKGHGVSGIIIVPSAALLACITAPYYISFVVRLITFLLRNILALF